MTEETVDISVEYLDFSFFYNYVSCEENVAKGETRIRRWLGVSDRVGRLVSYWIMTQEGTVTARTTAQCATNLKS